MRKLQVRLVAVTAGIALGGGLAAGLAPPAAASAAVAGQTAAGRGRAALTGPAAWTDHLAGPANRPGEVVRSARTAHSSQASPRPGALARGLATARRLGRRVEVLPLRTDTTQVFANPSGTVTVQRYAQPVRVRRGRSWEAVDTRLRARPDGSVAPVAAVAALRLSGGGSGPLARLTDGSRQVAISWPGRLPAPVLAGDIATYPNVLAGVDLRVRATVDGFTEVLVVKNRAAAADPGLAAIQLGLATAGVTVKAAAGGGLAAVDRGGRAVFTAARPLMWDSGSAARTTAMGLRVGHRAITVLPDRGMLAAKGTRFPVFIDPAVSLGLAAWGNVVNVAPNQTMNQDPFRSQGLKAGYGCDSSCYVYRSALAFGLGGLYGKHILSATFGITMYHSWSCSPTPVQLWLTSAIDPNSTTWNNLGWGGELDQQSAEANCGGPAVWMVFSGGLAGQVQAGANASWPAITVGLKAPNEGDVNQWKRFDANAVLSVVYNSYPNTPDALTVDGKPCVTGAGRPYVSDLTPTLTAHVSDPDPGDLLGVRFAGAPLGGSLTSWVNQDNLANGGTANIKIPAGIVSDGGVYSFQAYATDYTDNSSWSAPCEFGVDVTPPGPPTVSSTDYPDDQAFHGMEGVTGHFVFSPPASHPEDVAAYLVGLNSCNQPTCATVYPSAADHSGAADITPNLAGPNVLNVWTRDKAGNLSNGGQPVTYTFLVRSPTGPAATYPMNQSTGTTTADSTGHGNTATLTGGATWTGMPCTVSGAVTSCNDTGRRGAGGALSLDGSTGYAATAGPLTTPDPNNPGQQVPVRTDASFTVSAWLNPSDVTPVGPNYYYPTAVSADGVHTSAFFLRRSFAPNAVWVFTMVQSDTDGAPLVNLYGTSPVRPGTWTFVAGSYDAATKTMRLYVNGVLEASTTIPGTFNATGPLVIGRAEWESALNHFWHGQIDDVRFDARLLSGAEIAALANAPVMTGDWELGEGSGTTAHDTSGAALPADASLAGGTSWVPVDPADARPSDGGLPPGSTALNFDGSTGTVTAPGNQVPFPVPIANPTGTVYNGALHVVARATGTGHILHAWCVACDGTDWHVEDLGGVTTGAPSMAVYNSQLHVVAEGSAGPTPTVYQKYWNGSTWSDWQIVLKSAAAPTTAVYAGALHVVARASDTGHVLHAVCVVCDGTDWSSEDLGGVITGTPSVGIYNGQFHIVADGSDGTIVFQNYWSGSAWSGWQEIAGSQTDPVASVYNGALHVTARATGTGNVMHEWCSTCDGSDWHSENLGGVITGAPSVGVYNGQFHIVADGSDGTTVYQNYWGANGWSGWQVIEGAADQPFAIADGSQLHVLARASTTSSMVHAWCSVCDGSDWGFEGQPVVDTGHSFTVTAWVRLTGSSITRPETVAGLDALHVSGFLLGEDNSAGPPRWRFEMHTADADNDLGDTAWSTAPPALGTWTALAGVFDAQTHTIKLYVDGVLAGTASHTSTWSGTGPLVIGREKWQDTTNINPWGGDIASVQVYSGVLSDQQIADLAGA